MKTHRKNAVSKQNSFSHNMRSCNLELHHRRRLSSVFFPVSMIILARRNFFVQTTCCSLHWEGDVAYNKVDKQ